MDEDARAPGRLLSLVSSAASVVAPLSVLSALLFYFGYASSRAQYEYFGLDVDTIGLSTQDYVMRSPQPLLMPLLVLTLLGILVAATHVAICRRIAVAVADADHKADDAGDAGAAGSRRRLERIRRRGGGLVFAGGAALAGGVGLLFSYAVLREWAPYPLVTALLLALGAAMAAYGLRIQALAGRRERFRGADLSIYLLLAASVFWATATLAQWSGRGSAEYAAAHMDRLPSVILDTRERLFLTSPNVTETVLQPSSGQTFHYRYRRLRLLIQGRDRLFLVPESWSASNSTLVVPTNDGSVRLQFQFQNVPP